MWPPSPLCQSAAPPGSWCGFRRTNPSACPTSLRAREDTRALALHTSDMTAWAWKAVVQIALGLRRSKSMAIWVRGSSRTAGSVLPRETSVFYLVCKNLMGRSAGNILVMETPINICLLASINTTSNASIDIWYLFSSLQVKASLHLRCAASPSRCKASRLLLLVFPCVCVYTYTRMLWNTSVILYS